MNFLNLRLKVIIDLDVLTFNGKEFQSLAPKYCKVRLNDSVECLGIHRFLFEADRE